MTSRELIWRIVRHDSPERIGWDFLDPRYQDIRFAPGPKLANAQAAPYEAWGEYPELRARVNGFTGELRMDKYGNIFGRLNQKTNGECIHGALSDDWDALGGYVFPTIEPGYVETLQADGYDKSEKFVLSYLPVTVFSTLRDCRHMDNALMDTIAEPDMVRLFLKRSCALITDIIDAQHRAGVDAIILCDDWGTQTGPFISPASFARLFKPAYKLVADACHERGMAFFLHSCGCILTLVDDLIDAGVDCFQFDQPENSGSDLWAAQYGRKAAFYMPVDIQRIMVTGDRALIEQAARNMCDVFRASGGSFIAKDYPSWADINVKREWAAWAMDVFVANAKL